MSLAELEIDSIPINALMPIPGTPLEGLPQLSEADILRTIAFFRYLNPEANIRLAAGRALLTKDGETAFQAGASATITGNMLTTVANYKVYDAFYSDDPNHALMHGPTFMGNALACAAALKGIEIFEREDYLSKIKQIEAISKREMLGFTDPRIKEVRVMGGCTCVEVYDPKDLAGFQEFAYQRGVFSRPFLSYMYSMVPYIIQEDELVKIFDTMKAWFRR